MKTATNQLQYLIFNLESSIRRNKGSNPKTEALCSQQVVKGGGDSIKESPVYEGRLLALILITSGDPIVPVPPYEHRAL